MGQETVFRARSIVKSLFDHYGLSQFAKDLRDSLDCLPPLEQRRQARLTELMQLEEEYVTEISRLIFQLKKVFRKLEMKYHTATKMKNIQRETDEIFKLVKESFEKASSKKVPFSKDITKRQKFYIEAIGSFYIAKVPEIVASFQVLTEYINEDETETFGDLPANSLLDELSVTINDILDSLTHYFVRLQISLKHVLSCTPRQHPDHHPLREIVQVLNKLNKENSTKKFMEIEKIRSESCPLPDVKNQCTVKRRYSWDNGTLKKIVKLTRSISFIRNSKKLSTGNKDDYEESIRKNEFMKELITTLDGSSTCHSTPKSGKSSSAQNKNGISRRCYDSNLVINSKVTNERFKSKTSTSIDQSCISPSNINDIKSIDDFGKAHSLDDYETENTELSGKVVAIPESSPTLIRGNLEFYSYNGDDINPCSNAQHDIVKKPLSKDKANPKYYDVLECKAGISEQNGDDCQKDRIVAEKMHNCRINPESSVYIKTCSSIDKKKTSFTNRKISLPESNLFKKQSVASRSKNNRIVYNHRSLIDVESSYIKDSDDQLKNSSIKSKGLDTELNRTFSHDCSITNNHCNYCKGESNGQQIKYKLQDCEENIYDTTKPVLSSDICTPNSYENSVSPSITFRKNVSSSSKVQDTCISEQKSKPGKHNNATVIHIKRNTSKNNTREYSDTICESNALLQNSTDVSCTEIKHEKYVVENQETNFVDDAGMLDASSKYAGENSKELTSPVNISPQNESLQVPLLKSDQDDLTFDEARDYDSNLKIAQNNLTICSDFNKTVRNMLEASLSCVDFYRHGITYGNSTFYCKSTLSDNMKHRSISTSSSTFSNARNFNKALIHHSATSIDNSEILRNTVSNLAAGNDKASKNTRKVADMTTKSRDLVAPDGLTFAFSKNSWESKSFSNGNTIDGPAVSVKRLTEKTRKIPKDKVARWSAGLDSLLLDKYGIKIFQIFLRLEYSEENLLFWLACESFKSLSPSKLVKEALRIYKLYIEENSAKEVNLDHETRSKVREAIKNPGKAIFNEAQSRIKNLMAQDSYPRFIKSSMYQGMVQ